MSGNDKRAREWVKNYGGSIDALALRLAYQAGAEERDAAWYAEACRCFDDVQPREKLMQVFETLECGVIHECWKRDPRVVEAESEGRKRGLVQAEAIARDRGDKLSAWMVTLPMHSEERKDKSFRAGECFAVADEIAALASKEETNE